MKLKKIASLALAGIMAVSMLAGCKDGGNSNSGSSSSSTTTVNDVSSIVEDALSQEAKNRISFKSDNNVAVALQKLADNNVSGANVVTWYDTGVQASTALTPVLAGTSFLDCEDDIADLTTMANANTANDKAKTAVEVYVAGQDMSRDAILRGVAANVEADIEDLASISADNTYEYTYTGSVSVVTKTGTNSNGTTRTISIIAVSVTRTPSKV